MNAARTDTWVDYDYAVVRLVPKVHLEAFVPIGVVLHARTARFLGVRLVDADRVAAHCRGGLDADRVARYLDAYVRVGRGGVEAGPIGALPPSERFHWMTAPRSTVLQTSELRAGRTKDPAAALDRLFEDVVTVE